MADEPTPRREDPRILAEEIRDHVKICEHPIGACAACMWWYDVVRHF